MILSLLNQLFHDALAFTKAKLAERAFKQRQLKALNKHGFDVKCPGCNSWMNTDKTAIAVVETEEHWHYLCKCGHRSAWYLGAPCPIHDPDYKYQNDNPLFVDERA